MSALFRNRHDAGVALAHKLDRYRYRPDVVVLGLPRGGVPVAFEVARALEAPLDVFVVRKLGLPAREEVAMGAIASGDVRVVNRELVRALGIRREVIEEVTARERTELERRERLYRAGMPFLGVENKIAILVDDGIATGASVSAAIAALSEQAPARIVVAAPVAAPSAREALRPLIDELVTVIEPASFFSVGVWYLDFSATTDDEVRELLRLARVASVSAGGPSRTSD